MANLQAAQGKPFRSRQQASSQPAQQQAQGQAGRCRLRSDTTISAQRHAEGPLALAPQVDNGGTNWIGDNQDVLMKPHKARLLLQSGHVWRRLA
jgi:hypothetical protein